MKKLIRQIVSSHPVATGRLLYTNDCTGIENTIFMKYSDDTANVILSNPIPHCMSEVERFSTWCKKYLFGSQHGKNKGITY